MPPSALVPLVPCPRAPPLCPPSPSATPLSPPHPAKNGDDPHGRSSPWAQWPLALPGPKELGTGITREEANEDSGRWGSGLRVMPPHTRHGRLLAPGTARPCCPPFALLSLARPLPASWSPAPSARAGKGFGDAGSLEAAEHSCGRLPPPPLPPALGDPGPRPPGWLECDALPRPAGQGPATLLILGRSLSARGPCAGGSSWSC